MFDDPRHPECAHRRIELQCWSSALTNSAVAEPRSGMLVQCRWHDTGHECAMGSWNLKLAFPLMQPCSMSSSNNQHTTSAFKLSRLSEAGLCSELVIRILDLVLCQSEESKP